MCSDDESDSENQRHVIVSGEDIEIGAHEEVSTSEASGSVVAPSTSSSLRSTLKEIGPLKSNRGRKPMTTTILTSPANVCQLKEKCHAK